MESIGTEKTNEPNGFFLKFNKIDPLLRRSAKAKKQEGINKQ